MESEKGWAIWHPSSGILYAHIYKEKERAIKLGYSESWMKNQGYRIIPITISYEKPKASDE